MLSRAHVGSPACASSGSGGAVVRRLAANIEAMRTDPSDNGGLFVGAPAGHGPDPLSLATPTRQRATTARRRLARRHPAGGDHSHQPALLGSHTARLPLDRLPGRLPLRQREPRDPRRVHRAVRAAVRGPFAHAPARPGMDPRPPRRRGTTSERALWGGSSRSPRSSARSCFMIWFLVIHGPGSSTFSGGGRA